MAIKRYDCVTCKVRKSSILDLCETDTLVAISTYKQTRIIQKGEYLFQEGAPIKGVFFIKKGFVKIEVKGKGDRPLILSIAGKGAILGHKMGDEMISHGTQAIAVSCVQCCYVPYTYFEKIAGDCTMLQKQIIRQFLKELELVKKKAISLAHKTVREKIAEALLLLADAHLYYEQQQTFRVSLCRQDIADLVGTTKEQVSKILKDFEKENIISCTGKRFSFMHIAALKAIAASDTTQRSKYSIV